MSNIKNGIKTTILGILFLLLGIGYLFYTLHKELDVSISLVAGFGVLGIAFLFFPDDFLTKLKNALTSMFPKSK